MPKVCELKISTLKKLITQKRKQAGLTGPHRTKASLVAVLNDHYNLLRRDKAIKSVEEFSTLKKPELARILKYVKKTYHPAVSRLAARQILQYVWATEASLGWDWPSAVSKAPAKKRISKACRQSDGSVAGGRVPNDLLPNRRSKRANDADDLQLAFNDTATGQKRKKKKKKATPKAVVPDDSDTEEDEEEQQADDTDIRLEPETPPPAPRRKRKAPSKNVRTRDVGAGFEFAEAPRKKKAPAKTSIPVATKTKTKIRKGAKLTAAQKEQVNKYKGKAPKSSLRLYMLAGKTLPEAIRAIAERQKREVAPVSRPKRKVRKGAGKRFMDTEAS